MNGGGGGDAPIVAAIQVNRLNAAVGLLRVGMNEVNAGVAFIDQVNMSYNHQMVVVDHLASKNSLNVTQGTIDLTNEIVDSSQSIGMLRIIVAVIQVNRLNAAVGLLRVGMNEVNAGVALIQALNDPQHANRLRAIHNFIGQVNGSLGHIETVLGGQVVNHHHLMMIVAHINLISESTAYINNEVAQIGRMEMVAGLLLGPTVDARIRIHRAFTSVHGGVATVLGIIHAPVAPVAPQAGPPNGGGAI